jgi:hypothetical protein
MNDPDRRLPSDGFDADAIFADIVAHLNDDAVEPRTGTPRDEDERAGAGTAEHGGVDAAADSANSQPPDDLWLPVHQPPVFPLPDLPEAGAAPQVWRAHEVDDEYEEHFEPPPVAPLPVGDLQFWAIIAGMAGGPLLLLYLVLFNRDAGTAWVLTSIVMSVGGFVLLVLRLPREGGDDDDGIRL